MVDEGDAMANSKLSGSKPTGRMGRHYRLMWDQNHGYESFFNPPMAPESVAMAHFGDFEGSPVDTYVGAIGPDAGYVTAFKSEKTQMEYLVVLVVLVVEVQQVYLIAVRVSVLQPEAMEQLTLEAVVEVVG